MYPAGATSVCCAVCSTVTAVPAPGMHMNQTHFAPRGFVSNVAAEHRVPSICKTSIADRKMFFSAACFLSKYRNAVADYTVA